MIGTALSHHLAANGHEIIILTRDPSKHRVKEHISYAAWDVEQQQLPILPANLVRANRGATIRWCVELVGGKRGLRGVRLYIEDPPAGSKPCRRVDDSARLGEVLANGNGRNSRPGTSGERM